MNLDKAVIPEPYNDWRAVRALGSDLEYGDGVEYRYRACMGLGNQKDYNPDRDWHKPVDIVPLTETPYLDMNEVRRIVTVAFAKKVESEFPRGKQQICADTGFNNTLISKHLQFAKYVGDFTRETTAGGILRAPAPLFEQTEGKGAVQDRPFSAPLTIIPAVADYVMHSSVHRMFFGEEGWIVLPSKYSVLANGFSRLSASDKAGLIEIGRMLMSETVVENNRYTADNDIPNLSAYGQTRRANEILYERLLELSADNPYLQGGKYVFDRTTGGAPRLKNILGELTSEANRDAPPKTVKDKDTGEVISQAAYEPIVGTIMFFALESGQAMDFFIRNDYINIAGGASPRGTAESRVKIFRTHHHEPTLISDADDLRILSFCVSLAGERKEKMLSEIIMRLIRTGYIPESNC